MQFKLPKISKLPKIPHLPRLNIEPVKKILAFFIRHKIAITILVSFILFITVAMWYRGYLLSKMNTTAKSNNDEIFYSSKGQNIAPSIALPSPGQNNNSVLGNTTSSNNNYAPVVFPTPFPTFAPLVTVAPLPPTTTTTTTSSSNNSGNSSCTTANGTPNSWYSDFYPASPISSTTGSPVTINVHIRDCGQNDVSSDSLTISQTSSDSTLTINGSSAPVTIQVQNGQANFTVNSQNAGTDTLQIQDTTSNFPVTDIHNTQPLSITFSGSSTTPTPTSTATPTPTPTATITPTPSITATPTS
jgi:hypothetical protein